MKTTSFAFVIGASMFIFCSAAQAVLIDDIKLKFEYMIDRELDSGSRGTLTSGGTMKWYKTYPKGMTVTVEGESGGAAWGTMKQEFECRYRKKTYEARLEVSTPPDEQHPGNVEGKFFKTPNGPIMASEIKRTGVGRCGESIERHWEAQ